MSLRPYIPTEPVEIFRHPARQARLIYEAMVGPR